MTAPEYSAKYLLELKNDKEMAMREEVSVLKKAKRGVEERWTTTADDEAKQALLLSQWGIFRLPGV